MMDGILLNQRYQLTSEIGRGGMGIVYRAYDTLLERDIAVKVLSNNALGTQGKTRLLREAQAAARLNHPNIISIYDAGDSQGMSYIVMELLDGDSLYEKKPSTLDESIEILCQICNALDHAHHSGIIHRDLKPENVIITSKGIAKLTDFGLSRSITSRISIESTIVGTVYYLAPEQALKQDIDTRADLYALGVMMYELLAGRLPFVADDPLAVISQHLNAPVVPPSTYNRSIPPVLDRLVVKLLSKRPEDRPSTAAEVREILQKAIENPDFDNISNPDDSCAAGEFSPIHRLALGRMVGRKRELAEIKRIWREILDWPNPGYEISPNVLVISGESGVGKTPLVNEIRTLGEVLGALIYQGNCYARTSAPYTPIAQVMRVLHPHPTDVPVSMLAEALEQASGHESSGYAQNNTSPYSSLTTPELEQQKLFEKIFLLFEELASQQPVILIIEDIQWADIGTLLLIHYLARRSRNSALKFMITTTYRPSELSSSPHLRNFLLDLNQERLAFMIPLEPFSRDQTRELLATMFMENISEELLDTIFNITEGNLFFIEEISKSMIEAGHLTCDSNGWQLNKPDEMELPQSIRMALQMRISRLPETAQDVLKLASMIGREFDFDILRNSCELDEDMLIDALEQAERAQLITEIQSKKRRISRATESFAFAHTLIPTILRLEISSLRRKRIHRRLATAMEQLRPDDLEDLAFHFSQAGDIDKARQYNLLAGERARKLHAHEDAIAFFTEALRLTPDHDPQRFNALSARERVYDLLALRDLQRSDIIAMLDLAEYSDDDTLRCDSHLALANFYLNTEHILAREPAIQAVDFARIIKDPLREARALRTLGFSAWFRNDHHESLGALEQAVIRFRQAGLLSDAAECLHMLSLTTGLQGLGELNISQRYAEDAVTLSRQSNNRRQEAISLRRLAITHMDQHKYDEALHIANQALLLHQEMKDRVEESSALNVIGLTLAFLNRVDEGLQYIHRSLDIAKEAKFNMGISLAIENIEWLHYWQSGDYEGGIAFIDDQLKQIEEYLNKSIVPALLMQKARIYHRIGQYELAIGILNKADQEASSTSTVQFKSQLYAQIALNYGELGDFDKADEALNSIQELSRRFERPLETAFLLSNRAFLGWLQQDPLKYEVAITQADQSVKLVQGTGWTYDMAEFLSVAARLSLATGDFSKALAQTTEALRILKNYPLVNEGLLFNHSRALRGSGREAEANQYLETAYQRVMNVLSKLKDREYQRSWIENARDNRYILLDWQFFH